MPDGSEVEISDQTLSVETELGSVTAHRNKARNRTIERWKDPEGYAAVRASYADEIQELENALWSVKYSRLIDSAFGKSLEVLGDIVGEGRDGRDDPSYRVRIRARIRVNQSFGTAGDLLAVLALLDPATFIYTPTPPAAYTIGMSAPPSGFATATEMAGLLGEATALGVGGLLAMPTDVDGFILGSTGSVVTVTTLGSSTGFPTPPLPDGRFISA
jgi:hypothetical protein